MKFLFFILTSLLFTGCATVRTNQVPTVKVSKLSDSRPIQYASEVKLFFPGEDIPAIDEHIASIRIVGGKYMNEDLLWYYLKHEALKNHANALINIEVSTIVKQEQNRMRDGEIYYSEYEVTELSGVAVLMDLGNTWTDEYSSSYKSKVDNHLAETKEQNKAATSFVGVVTIAVASVLLILTPEEGGND